jgi:hypothetical protein
MRSNTDLSTTCVHAESPQSWSRKFYKHDLAGQSTRLKFDDFLSAPYTITNGIGQGAPSSGTLFQFYNSPLLEIITDPSASATGAYYDDAYLLAAAPTFSECDEIMGPMTAASCE